MLLTHPLELRFEMLPALLARHPGNEILEAARQIPAEALAFALNQEQRRVRSRHERIYQALATV